MMITADLFAPFAAHARLNHRPSRAAKKPSSARTILIQRSSLAGFRHHAGERLRHALKLGTQLRLVREADNPHDPYAVAIYWNRYQLGYLARRDNTVLARLLDNQRPLGCTIERLYWAGSEAKIELAFWLERQPNRNS